MNTNDIIKSLGMISPTQMPPSLIKIIHERLEEADDIKETYQHVIRDDCAPDEQHCACVPFLRVEMARMKDELDFYHSPEASSIKRLQYQNYRMGFEIAENSVRFLVFNEVAKERDELRAELSENNAKKATNTRQLTCNSCDAVISSPVPSDTVVRAWCECPACIADKPDINDALAHLRAIVTANASYNDTAQELINAELWLRKIDG